MADNPAFEPEVQKQQFSRYRLWGIGYLVALILTSPIIGPIHRLVTGTVLPWLYHFHQTYFNLHIVMREGIELHFRLQVLLCNLILIAFSAIETFVRGGKRTGFDILIAFICGAAAILNAIMFLFPYGRIDFIYFTLSFAVLWTVIDAVGIAHSRKREPEMASTFTYSLAFVDGPTLAVCLFFVLPPWVSSIAYPQSFTDGIGAAILLFSGMAWTSLMVFFVAPRAGMKNAAPAPLGEAALAS